MIRNTNDGSTRAPALRCILNLGTLNDLPQWSKAPRSKGPDLLRDIKAAGYAGTQGGDPAQSRELGMVAAADGRVNAVGAIGPMTAAWRDKGYDAATLHVGWGMESDATIDALVGDILNASAKYDFPLYIETHRATITQDIWRTVQLVHRHPDVRFNGDFSHWYTGLEMVYGELAPKLEFAAPVFERVRFMHGRIGNPGSMQVDIGDGTGRTFVDHFKQMWTLAFAGFLRSARPGDYICFAPELLQPSIYYARTVPGPDGQPREEGDRWQQALLYCDLARECFAAAGASHGARLI